MARNFGGDRRQRPGYVEELLSLELANARFKHFYAPVSVDHALCSGRR